MTSILKMLSRPRLGLVVGMLFLFAGLFPQKAIGEGGDDAPSTGDAPASPPDTGSGSGNAKGRSEKGVKCYKCADYRGSQCLKAPKTQNTTDCPSGHCYESVEDFPGGRVERHCATDGHLKCFEKIPGKCSIFADIRGNLEDATKWAELFNCISPHKPRGRRDTARQDVPNQQTQKASFCLCQSDLCNTRTNISDAEANAGRDRDPGFIGVVVAAALLMTSKATPSTLRGFLVGSG